MLGIVAAHEKAVACSAAMGPWPASGPMLVVMVGFTCSGLMLLFAP